MYVYYVLYNSQRACSRLQVSVGCGFHILIDNLGEDTLPFSEGSIPSNITDYFLYMTET